jgi:septal ring factor EnvC (AmiA/AmiB activator)
MSDCAHIRQQQVLAIDSGHCPLCLSTRLATAEAALVQLREWKTAAAKSMHEFVQLTQQVSVESALVREVMAERDAARAEAERERIENTHLREAFVTMERAANEREAEAARLREAIERIKVSARGLWEGEAARAALDTPAREGGETW